MLVFQNQELVKSNQGSVEMKRSVKQPDSSKRVEKSRTEENANLARRVQREKDLQKQEARTPTPADARLAHPPPPS